MAGSNDENSLQLTDSFIFQYSLSHIVNAAPKRKGSNRPRPAAPLSCQDRLTVLLLKQLLAPHRIGDQQEK